VDQGIVMMAKEYSSLTTSADLPNTEC